MLFEGQYRRFLGMKGGKGPMDARITHQESLATAVVEPVNFEMTRAGRRFFLGISGAVTGIAPVQALPTTAAQWVLWNLDSSATYFLEELGMMLVSGTPGAGGVLMGALFQAPAQSGSGAVGLSVQSASFGARTSKALVKSVVTLTTPAAPTWFPVASNPSPNVGAFPGSATLERRDLAGAIAIPPGYGLALDVLAPAGTAPLFAPFARWIEQETDME